LFESPDKRFERKLAEQRGRETNNLVGKMFRPDVLDEALKFEPVFSRLGAVAAEESARAAPRTHARAPLVGGSGGAIGPTIATYNIITQANPSAVSSGSRGPLNYDSTFWGLGTRGSCLLMKFSTPYLFGPSIRSFIINLPEMLYSASGTYLNSGSSVAAAFDMFFLALDYDTATICWNNQPFLLTANGGGFNSTPLGGFEADNTTGGTDVALYEYANSLDDANTNEVLVDTSSIFLPYMTAPITSVSSGTTFDFDFAAGFDLSWLVNQTITFTAGPPQGASATVHSITNTSGTTWRLVTTASTTADNTTSFEAWMTLYGVGIGLSSPFGVNITTAQMTAFAADPIIYLGSQ